MTPIPPFVVSAEIPNDRPVVTAAVVPYTANGDVVMFRHRRGLLDFLGGHIEAGESIEDAVRREAMEEGGVVLGDDWLQIGYLVFDGDTPSYNPLYVAPVVEFVSVPPDTESAGRLVFGSDVVIAAMIDEPDHPWKGRHVEMMESALKVVAELLRASGCGENS